MSINSNILSKDEMKNFIGKHNHFTETIMIPNLNKTDNNRTQMFTAHINQCIQIANAEPPLIFSGFENQVGKYSSGYKKIKEDQEYELIYVFEKNKYNKIYLFKDKKTGIHDIVFRTEAENLTEHFGIKYNNDYLDNMKLGEVASDQVVYKDQNYDDEMNLQFGVNLNVAFLPYKGFTNEDAIIISESAAERMSGYFIKKVKIPINTNDIPLNLYGDEDEYQMYPRIGEEIKDGILAGTRRLNYDVIVYMLRNEALDKIEEGDNIYYTEGTVVDVEIYNNENMTKLREQQYSSQLVEDIEAQERFWTEFVTITESIVKSGKVTTELRNYYNRFKEFLDPNTRFSHDNNQFDKINMFVTVLEKRKIVPGSKISSRYGSKGIVSRIVPDDEMPEIEMIDGEKIRENTKIKKRAEMVLNPLGVINRLNPSQLYEMEINYTNSIIRYRLESMSSNKEKEKLLFTYLSDLDITTSNHYKKMYDSLDDEDSKEEFFEEIINYGIPILQLPFYGNITKNKMFHIFEKYEIKPLKVDMNNRDIVMGDMYHLRLRHEPYDKLSHRSVDFNNFTNMPTRTPDSKNYLSKTNNNPIRIGEQEVLNPNIGGSIDPIVDIMQSYANNPESRNKLLFQQLSGNPFDIDTSTVINEDNKNNNTMLIESLFDALNIEITSEDYGDDELPEISSLPLDQLEELIDHFKDVENIDPGNVKNYLNRKEK